MVKKSQYQDEVVWQGHPSIRGLLVHYYKAVGATLVVIAIAIALAKFGAISAGWCALVVILAAVGIVVWVWVCQKTTLYTITHTTISENFGIFVRKREQARISQITNITIIRNIPERMLGVGRMDIDTANDTSNILQWRGIKDPVAIENILNDERYGK